MNWSINAFRFGRRAGIATLAFLLMGSATAMADVSTERLRVLDEYLDRESAKFNLPGIAVAVTSQGEIVHEKIEGRAIESDSAFVIGSCSKTITALATLIALQNTNTDLNTPVEEILPRLKFFGVDEPPRIVHLLQHRSGLVRSQGFDVLPSLASLKSDGHTIRLRQVPGERFAYCNLNYSILGLIIENLTGQSFADFTKSSLFVPAGMHSSSCDKNAGGFAPEYQYCFGIARQAKTTDVPASRIPAGFIRCSAHDLARLQLALSQDGLIDGKQIFHKNIMQQMKSPPEESGFGYGMGVYRGNHRFGPLVAHEGATPTSYAFHGLLTEDDVGFVLLTNINLFDPFTDHGEAIYENILRILKGEPAERTLPIRIWVRWLVLGALVLTVWQMTSMVLRWRKSGWPFNFPKSAGDRISLAMQLLVPIAVWYAVLRWTQTPLITVFEMEPDLMWSFAYLTVSGVFTGCLRKCVPREVLRKQRLDKTSGLS